MPGMFAHHAGEMGAGELSGTELAPGCQGTGDTPAGHGRDAPGLCEGQEGAVGAQTFHRITEWVTLEVTTAGLLVHPPCSSRASI